ncbi:hypothetical protein [uncultured Roseibium sp.]|uniref:hypothetical protein n=1 Tax=uncultured Roseibium sp. TaxID=1936171 RepID=UPI003216CA70
MLGGTNLLGMSFADLIAMFKQVDPDIIVEYDGFTSLRFGIGGWAPSAETDPDEPLESIMVFVRGYFDSYYDKAS